MVWRQLLYTLIINNIDGVPVTGIPDGSRTVQWLNWFYISICIHLLGFIPRITLPKWIISNCWCMIYEKLSVCHVKGVTWQMVIIKEKSAYFCLGSYGELTVLNKTIQAMSCDTVYSNHYYFIFFPSHTLCSN